MKICVVTGTRAEYGLFYWLLSAIKADVDLDLQLLVTGMHLSPEFGLTYTEIEKDGFEISDSVEILLSGDTPVSIAKSSGLALIGFAESFRRLKPDLLVILGDRFEALAAAQAAMFANIPIAHLHGGESTEGLIDEAVRHSITKMSHIHFPSTEIYRQRIIQMGEQPECVFNVGALGVESSVKTHIMTLQQLQGSLNFDLSDKFFLVTYHPVTLDEQEQQNGLNALCEVLEEFESFKILITFPNADTFGRQVIQRLQKLASDNKDRVCLVESLGRVRYLSALSYCSCVIGNSSSGIIEAPSFSVPTVNIGSRQKGRVCAQSVVHCGNQKEEINSAIENALVLLSENAAETFDNPYYGGATSEKIINRLKVTSLDRIIKKSFYESK